MTQGKGIELEYIVLLESRLPQGLNAGRAQMGIYLRFIGVKARSKSNECSREEAADQSGSDNGKSMPRNFSPQHGSTFSLVSRCPESFGILFAGSCFGVMDLLHGVHSSIRLGEQTLHVETIFRAEGHTHTESDEVATANVASGVDRRLVETIRLFFCGFGCQSGSGDDEFISTHAGNVVVAAADVLETSGELAQQFVALEVPERVVDLLESVDVANQHSERRLHAAAACDFLRQMDEQRSGIG